jgi:hypothetical protein
MTMTNFIYKLIDPTGVDLEEYKKIHGELFKSAMIDDVWIDWYHKKVPTSDPRLSFTRTYGLFDGKRLIGIWSVEPKKLKDSTNNLINVGRCFAVGISSDYRRMGLFVTLSEFAIKSERERGEYDYIIGFPQTGRSVIGGHLKAGWEEIEDIAIYSIDLTSNDGIYHRNDVKVVTDFSNVPYCENKSITFDEFSEYRNIRFLKHPKLQYMMYSFGDAHIVLKPYSTFCHILEIRGSETNVKVLLEASKSICKRHGFLELNIWNNSNALFNKRLLDAGFSEGAVHGLPITIIAVKINAKEQFSINNQFNFGMGVEEGY